MIGVSRERGPLMARTHLDVGGAENVDQIDGSASDDFRNIRADLRSKPLPVRQGAGECQPHAVGPAGEYLERFEIATLIASGRDWTRGWQDVLTDPLARVVATEMLELVVTVLSL